MKTIIEYLINNHIKSSGCNQLGILHKLTDEETEAICTIANDFLDYYEDWYAEVNGTDMSIKEFFNEYVGEDTTNLFLVLAFMLSEDGDFEGWHKIGLKGYPGRNNPYDFSCFEEETDDGKTALDYMQGWLKDNKDNEYKFSFVYAGMNRNVARFKNASTFLDALINTLR